MYTLLVVQMLRFMFLMQCPASGLESTYLHACSVWALQIISLQPPAFWTLLWYSHMCSAAHIYTFKSSSEPPCKYTWWLDHSGCPDTSIDNGCLTRIVLLTDRYFGYSDSSISTKNTHAKCCIRVIFDSTSYIKSI